MHVGLHAGQLHFGPQIEYRIYPVVGIAGGNLELIVVGGERAYALFGRSRSEHQTQPAAVRSGFAVGV